MVKKLICSFCGSEIPPGTGLMFVRNDGKIFYYCSKKCYIYHQVRRKDWRKVKWVRKAVK